MTTLKLLKKAVALLAVLLMLPLSMRIASASSLADLTPTAIQYNSGSIAIGKRVLLDSGIQNNGGSDSGIFNIKWFVNDVQVGYGGHVSISPGTTDLNGNSAYEWTPSAPGTYVIRFVVDTDQYVPESNEDNNETSVTITIAKEAAPDAIDLIPTAILYNSAAVAIGKTVLLDSGIQNGGGLASGGFNVKWFVNDVQVGYGGHSAISAGTIDLGGNSAYQWTPPAEGTYTIIFAVDPENYIPESNERNNAVSITIRVQPNAGGAKSTNTPQVKVPPTQKPATTPSIPTVQKVMVLSFDPSFQQAGGVRLHDLVDGWNDPHDLAKQYQSDIKKASHDNAVYEIVEWNDLNELPRSTSGFSYSTTEYYQTLQKALQQNAYWDYQGWRQPNGFDFDYNYYLSQYDAYQKVARGEIDEVWIFTGPCTGVGAYESLMIGRGAYFCNSSPMVRQDCPAFVCYAFNYERDVGCMLEDAGHRMESIMKYIYGRWDYNRAVSQMNDWERFTLYEKVAPGNAACGNVHFAPNSTGDYDWGNKTKVSSTCNDWMNFPTLTGKKSTVNCSAWGNGDMRLHHIWWFERIPHAEGEQNGRYLNWWKYFLYPTGEY